jgi:hypothetical protein
MYKKQEKVIPYGRERKKETNSDAAEMITPKLLATSLSIESCAFESMKAGTRALCQWLDDVKEDERLLVEHLRFGRQCDVVVVEFKPLLRLNVSMWRAEE